MTEPLSPYSRLVRLLGRYRREIRYVILYAVVSGIIGLSLPLGVQAIVGMIMGGGISASWAVLVLFVVVGALFLGILRLMQLSVTEHIQRRLFADSALEFAVRIPRLNLDQLRNEHLPELANRFFDTITLQKGLPKLLIDGSTALLQIIFSLLLLSFYHATFASFSLVLLAILAVLFYWTGPRGVQTSLKESKFKYKLVYWLEEVGRVAATFKLAGQNRFPLRRTDELAVEYLEARAKHWRVLLIQFVSGIVFRVLVLSGFLILGSLLVMENELNIGQFIASEILILYVIDSVEKLILLHETGYDVLTATEKLGQFMDLPVEREGGIKVEEFCSDEALEVELRDLTYRYHDDDRPVLKNLNLKIPAGQRVAVAGYTASGKSALMQILSVVRRDYSGVLMFNGLNKQNLHLRSLREHIGDLSSQEDIFKGSVLENITLGHERIPLQRVLKVAEDVGLSEFLRMSPQGIETQLLPGGKNTPGSVINKILVARAVLHEPKLLVLEDPTGRLNSGDHLRVCRYLTDRAHPWTMVSITGDPAFAAMCDRILILKEGELIFDGTFEEARGTSHYERVFRLSHENDVNS